MSPQVALPEGSQAQMSLYLRQNQLALDLGRKEAFVANLLPLVADCMGRLQQDAQIMNDPALPKTLQRAIQRRRRYAKKSRVGAGGLWAECRGCRVASGLSTCP